MTTWLGELDRLDASCSGAVRESLCSHRRMLQTFFVSIVAVRGVDNSRSSARNIMEGQRGGSRDTDYIVAMWSPFQSYK